MVQTATDFSFKLPLPCQGTGAVSHFNLPNTSTEHSVSHQTRRNSEIQNDFFDRRPDLEDMLLDALELSMSDYVSHKFPPTGNQPTQVMERKALKIQVSETIRKSQRQLQ